MTGLTDATGPSDFEIGVARDSLEHAVEEAGEGAWIVVQTSEVRTLLAAYTALEAEAPG